MLSYIDLIDEGVIKTSVTTMNSALKYTWNNGYIN